MAPGDELTPGTIRDSNSFVIGALARSWGADVRLIGIARDTVADLTGRLDEAGDVDLIVTSGGVSLGDYDLVKDVLQVRRRGRDLAGPDETGETAGIRAHRDHAAAGAAGQSGGGGGQLHPLWQTRDPQDARALR